MEYAEMLNILESKIRTERYPIKYCKKCGGIKINGKGKTPYVEGGWYCEC